jgi:hypothetical protein
LEGESNGEIAEALGVDCRVVEMQCTSFFRRDGVKGRKGLREKMQKSEVRIQNSEVGGGMTNDHYRLRRVEIGETKE